ncbi:MAG: coenzyme F420-0:L-glutamate ligase / coenzyme F420-1:gamma-L-glutamate ligase [Parcubacteria group bacterium Gr01-1014_38]|nr:MAG: coenzyme F420-0:L-glutamate ligase / coenzyme F420-1:gamma-L-glutamate ligase [Parcubacteria group bacterium Gr01-1014_38]
MKTLSLYALEGIPLIQQGDDIGSILCEVAEKDGVPLQDGDVIVIASKIVSKAEGRLVDVQKVEPSKEAAALAEQLNMDPRNLEVILQETKRMLIARPGFLLTEHLLGFICTSAGVDSSNTVAGPKGRVVSLLPQDPDASAERIRQGIERKAGRKVAVVINDTFGRADREGSVGMTIGISGIAAVYRPAVAEDIHGKKRTPEIAQVDEIAAAASLVMGQTNERRPVVIVRGVQYQASETSQIRDLLHPVTKYLEDARDALARAERLEEG